VDLGDLPPVSPSLDKGGGRIVEKRGFAPLRHPLFLSRLRITLREGEGFLEKRG
jgi:hypothetical protein